MKKADDRILLVIALFAGAIVFCNPNLLPIALVMLFIIAIIIIFLSKSSTSDSRDIIIEYKDKFKICLKSSKFLSRDKKPNNREGNLNNLPEIRE